MIDINMKLPKTVTFYKTFMELWNRMAYLTAKTHGYDPSAS